MALLIIAFLLTLAATSAKTDLTIGTDFIFAFPCFVPPNMPSMLVINANSNQATVTVTSSISNFTTMQKTVAGNSALQIFITDVNVQLDVPVCNTNTINKQGVNVRTSIPVTLYMHLADPDGNDVSQFLVLPIDMLTPEYPISKGKYLAMVVATQDGTQITIGGTHMTLNRLDVYYTTMSVTAATAKFAYIVTYATNTPSAVMALPNSYSSTITTLTPDLSFGYWEFNIWALEDGTTVSINGEKNVTVNVNRPYDLFIRNGGTVVASKPVQVFQPERPMDYGYALINLPNTFLSTSVKFYTFGKADNVPTLSITVPLESTGNILLDGHAIPALKYHRIPNSRYYYYWEILPGPAMLHTLSTTTSSDQYSAFIYYSSGYSYTIAMNLTRTA